MKGWTRYEAHYRAFTSTDFDGTWLRCLAPQMNYTNGDGMGFVHHSYKAVWPDSRREKGFGIMPLNGSIAA